MYDRFEHTHVLYTSSCDMRGWWKLSSVLDAMQTTADRHNELLKCSRMDIREQGLTWVLFKTVVQMERYPQIGERITVKTFTKAPCMYFIPRYYEMIDEHGNIISRAGSLWVLQDIKTKKHVLPQSKSIHLPENPDCPAEVNLLIRQQIVEGETIAVDYKPNCCDIDMNGHVNNIRYLDWLYNILGYEVMQKCAFNSIVIEYNYESLPGHALRNFLVRSGDCISFRGYEDDKINFSISGCLADRRSFACISS